MAGATIRRSDLDVAAGEWQSADVLDPLVSRARQVTLAERERRQVEFEAISRP